MIQKVPPFVAIAACLVASTVTHAIEVRTYQFSGTEPVYTLSCGECGAPPYETRAGIEGTFQVALDFANGTGELVSLDAQLVNFEGLFPIAGGWEWQPFGGSRTFLSESYLSNYRPPVSGILAPAESHPYTPSYTHSNPK